MSFMVKFVLLVLCVIIYTSLAFADHNSNATIYPKWSMPGVEKNYTVTICNEYDGNDSIDEVRIYETYNKTTYYTITKAYDKTGWSKYILNSLPLKKAYGYSATDTPYYINAGSCSDFKFSAIGPSYGCNLTWVFETRDTNNVWKLVYDYTSIDGLKPEINKTIIGSQYGNCPPEENEVCWITTCTLINITVTDKGECDPPSGLDWCRITYTLDGSGPYEIIYEDLNGEESWNYTFSFSNESHHVLNITCKDVAGNIVTDIEEFKVDNTPPETNKTYGEPHFSNGTSEWITSSTPITLTAVDEKEPCAVGVEKTWYLDTIVDNSYCMHEEACQSVCPSPYDVYYGCTGKSCAEWAQEQCAGITGDDWYTCVENKVNSCVNCQNGEWKLYRGTSITKDQESCHIIQFFSADYLGNYEQMNIQCVFVDDTPPIGTKEVGEPSVYEVVGEKYDEDYFIVEIENPTNVAITGDIELHGQIKIDGWESITDEVCVALSEDISYYFDPYWGGCNGPNGNGCGPDTPGQTWEEWLAAYPDWMDWYVTDYEIIDGKYCGCGNLNMCDPDLTNNHNDPDIIPVLSWTDGKIIISDQTIPANSKVWAVVKIKILEDGTYRFNIKVPEGLVMSQSGWDMQEFAWVRDNVTPITLTCEDPEPHPSGDEEVCYKVSLDGSDVTDEYCDPEDLEDVDQVGYKGQWCCVPAPETIIFKEDSLHDLEYFCRDAVDKKSEIDLEYFKVDSQPPVIEKTIIGPKVGNCPPEDENDKCWIKDWTDSNGTTIHIDAYDNDTLGCAVDQITCDWWYVLDGNQTINETYMQGLTPPFNITFDDETEHELHVKCCDALGNCYEDIETFYVDSSGPDVTKEFIGPQYTDGYSEWIDTVTNISLTAHDNPNGECAVGEDKIYYRYKLALSEDWCYNQMGYCQQIHNPEDSGWTEYTGPFGIPAESCHVLEYYAVDKLGNVGPVGVNCFFADHTKPVAKLRVGDPHINCTQGEDCDYWVRDHVTPIYLNCENRGPHPSPLDKIQWRIWSDITGNWTEWNESQAGVEGYDVTIIFTEDSLHKIQYKCNDTVGKESNLKEKVFRVDSQPPVIEKEMFGSYLGECPPENPPENETDKCYVADNGESGVSITVFDPDPTGKGCAVDNVECEYHLYWATNEYTCKDKNYTWEGKICLVENGTFGEEGKDILFQEDSTHYLYIHCEDALGNSVEDSETFLVDSTPPVTTKIYGTPTYVGDDYRWITSDTLIELIAIDKKVGVENISYRVTLVGNETCLEQCNYTGNGNWTIVNNDTAQFTLSEDSCHLIEYYAVDKLGNEEMIHKQCVMVDNTPPETTKEVGEPKLPCNETEDCDYWINQSTPIYLYCTDQEPHPVGADKIYYRYRVDGGNWSDWIEYPIDTIYFNEDSVHDLEYYCVDILGNEGEHHIQTYRVDSTPPTTTKIYGEPYYTDNISEWITSSTSITLTAEDGGDVCAIGTDKIYYRVELVSDESCWNPSAYCFPAHNPDDPNWTEYTAPFTIDEESCHRIEYYSVDELGNEEQVKAQCVFVDNTPPTLWKEHDESMIKDSDPELGTFYWMTQDMQIDLYCEDEGDHPVNHVSLWYRVWDDVSGEWSEWIDPNGVEVHKTITFDEDSVHKIQYYCEDALGNNDGTQENPHEQIYKVDSTPPETEKTYEGPYYEDENGVEYIDTATTIELDAVDGGDVCHVDGVKTYYRYSLINDNFCLPGNCKPYYIEFSHHPNTNAGVDFTIIGGMKINNIENLDLVIAIPGWPNITSSTSYDWENNVPVPFMVSYDINTGLITLDIDGTIITSTYDPGKAFESLAIVAHKGMKSLGVCDISLTDLKVNGIPIGDLKTYEYPNTIPITKQVYLTDGVQENGFIITGKVTMNSTNFPMACKYAAWFNVLAVGTHDINYTWDLYAEPFDIPEESCHVIEYYSEDALGNKEETKYQCVFVDKTPPIIEKEYGEPYFSENGVEWITSSTPIYVEVYDPEPHPSGVKEVKYKVSLVDDKYCWNQTLCQDAEGSGTWQEGSEEFEFTIPDESCHLIEIYAEDNVGKNALHKQCVFVDNSAPEPNKTVGKPRTKWDGKDAYYYDIADKCWSEDPEKFIECWKVTRFTPITLDCIDPEPHPVDHEETCFRVEVDGDDKTEFYCDLTGGIYNKSGDGFCCGMNAPYQFYFNEETEHNLEYYCVDALGNTGPVDEEKFKVEGTSFNITINKKWNLISVPFVMLNDSIDEVFKDIADDIISVWTYDGETGNWSVYTPDGDDSNDNLHEMKPGWGYWVLARNDTQLVIGGSLFSPAKTPPARVLVPGWNLIGYYGTDGILDYDGPDGEGSYAYCALYSLVNLDGVILTKWTSLLTYWEPYNPYQWVEYDRCDRLDPGAGYWIFMVEGGTYSYSTVCPAELWDILCRQIP